MKDAAALFGLAILLGVGVLLVPPLGEFPLCDDFDYANTALILAEKGELRISDCPIATLVVHAAWGALFVKCFGYSYAVLRAANLTMALIASWSAYGLGRQLGVRRPAAFLMAVVLLMNPVVLSLSYTFYTNVTGIALMLASIWLSQRAVASGRLIDFFLAGTCGALAYLARQTAGIPMLVFLASAFVGSLGDARRGRQFAMYAIPVVACLTPYYFWLHQVWGPPYSMRIANLNWEVLGGPRAWAQRLVEIALSASLQLGPLAAAWFVARWPLLVGSRRFWKSAAIAVLTLLALGAIAGRLPKPISSTMIADFALGVDRSLPPADGSALRGPAIGAFGFVCSIFGLVTGVIAWTSAPVLAVAIARAIRKVHVGKPLFDRLLQPMPQLVLSLLGALGVVMLTATHETYLLSPLALMVVLTVKICGPWNRMSLRTAGIGVAIFAAFGFAGVDDMLVRNRTLWRALDRLSHIDPQDVNGGWEYAGVYRFCPVYFREEPVPPFLFDLPPAQRQLHIASYWPNSYFVASRRYTISLAPLKDHEILATDDYQSWLRRGTIYTLKRLDPSTAPRPN